MALQKSEMSVSHAPHFLPQWRGPLEGYAVNTCRRSFPKLKKFYEFEDLYQEAYAVYLRCRTNYGKVATNPKWFMALYKTCLANRIRDLIELTHRGKHLVPVDSDDLTDMCASEQSDCVLRVSLSQLPNDLIDALKLMLIGTGEIVTVGSSVVRATRNKLEEHLL